MNEFMSVKNAGMPQQIQHKGKIIGRIEGKKFIKLVNPEIHKMYMFDGYGIQESVFEELKESVDSVLIKETTGDSYEVDIDVWDKEGIIGDFGAGRQRFLSVKKMSGSRQLSLL